MKKILQLTTYPIENPDHGGKLRCHNIRKVLRKDFEVETLSFDVQEQESINDLSITLNQSELNDIVGHYYFFDWGINNYLAKKESLKKTIFKNVQTYAFDIVIVEQGFLWPVVKEMIEEGVLKENIFIIYSSHNIEYQMKEEIYQDTFSGQELINYVHKVKELEHDMIKSSDLIFAVSQNDVDYIKNIVPQTNVFLYRNGHNGIEDISLIDKWKDKFTGSKRNWVYIASWHGPNINGLYKLIENGLLELDSNEVTLWVLGSVGPGLIHEHNIKLDENSPLKIIGATSSEDIDSAISASTGIVLPIWEGGGSNLKTAQALLSNKKIIAATFAFRGFENFLNESGLFVSENASELIKEMSTSENLNQNIERKSSVNDLKWDNLLSSLTTAINKNYEEKK